jgi:hypothetical protein
MNTVPIIVNPGTVEVDIDSIEVDINPKDVLDKMPLQEIIDYLNERDDIHDEVIDYDEDYYKELAFDFFRGDFNLKKLIEEVGVEDVLRSVGEIIGQELVPEKKVA